MPVCGIVVHHELRLLAERRFPVDPLEDPEPFNIGTPAVRTEDRLAVKVAEGGWQVCRAMSTIVVRGGEHMPDAQWRPGCVLSPQQRKIVLFGGE